jgi:hypothetical protein
VRRPSSGCIAVFALAVFELPKKDQDQIVQGFRQDHTDLLREVPRDYKSTVQNFIALDNEIKEGTKSAY